MYTSAIRPQSLPITWVLVANDKQAQIYEYDRSPQSVIDTAPRSIFSGKNAGRRMIPLHDGLITAAQASSFDAVSNTNYPGNTTWNPQESVLDCIKRRFISAIVGRLQLARARSSYDRLVLIAPAETIDVLKQQLDTSVQNCIVGILSKSSTLTL